VFLFLVDGLARGICWETRNEILFFLYVKLWAIDTKTGKAIWSHDVSDCTGKAGSASRTSPAYWNGELGNLMTPNLLSSQLVCIAQTALPAWVYVGIDPKGGAL
jgi:hypothetical protein